MFLTGDLKKITTYYAEPMMLFPAGRAVSRAEAEPIMERARENRRSRGIVKEMLETVSCRPAPVWAHSKIHASAGRYQQDGENYGSDGNPTPLLGRGVVRKLWHSACLSAAE